MQRHLIEEGVKEGFVTSTGMIAQGRGEAFDYLLGEKTIDSAKEAECAAVGRIFAADDPTISVNGNVAALCAEDVVALADCLDAKIEVNLFYWTREREQKVGEVLIAAGAERVYGLGDKVDVPGLDSARGRVDPDGIYKSDCILVMLEDGDRTEWLKKMGKFVIAIDLNPFSRTAQMADITIVDNVVRAIPNMLDFGRDLVKGAYKPVAFDNLRALDDALREIKKNLG